MPKLYFQKWFYQLDRKVESFKGRMKMEMKTVDILTIAIAAAALALSAFTYWQTDKSLENAAEANQLSRDSLIAALEHNQKSLQPKLAFRYKLSIGANDGGYFLIKNVGQGLADIVSIQANYKGNKQNTDAASLSDLGREFGMVGYNFNIGEALGAGDTVKIFDIPPRRIDRDEICPEDKARKEFFENLELHVVYKSTYGKEDNLILKYTSPNRFDC